MKDIARTCSCGARIEPGGICPRCTTTAYRAAYCIRCGAPTSSGVTCDRCSGYRPDEKTRGAHRKHYATQEYRTNRRLRYQLAGGRCETCGKLLIGNLHRVEDGAVRWEADHVIELVDGGADDLGNLRVRCVPCHRRKSQAAGRVRRIQRRRLGG